MLRNRNCSSRIAILLSGFLLGACAPAQTPDAGPEPGVADAQVQRAAEEVADTLTGVRQAEGIPLRCEERQARETVQRYQPGRAMVLSVYNYRLIVPPGALDTVATFTLHAPRVPRAEILIRPQGEFDGFNPQTPVTLSMGFAHCERPEPGRRLMVRRYRVVDGLGAGANLEGEVDMGSRTIRIPRDDLSGYVVVQI